jgi:hypothetical protein
LAICFSSSVPFSPDEVVERSSVGFWVLVPWFGEGAGLSVGFEFLCESIRYYPFKGWKRQLVLTRTLFLHNLLHTEVSFRRQHKYRTIRRLVDERLGAIYNTKPHAVIVGRISPLAYELIVRRMLLAGSEVLQRLEAGVLHLLLPRFKEHS